MNDSPSARLKKTDEKAASLDPNGGPGSTVQGCPDSDDEVIEVLVVGEDDKPLKDIPVALRQDGATEILGATSPEGIARFEGLESKTYALCLYKHDKDAWEVLKSEALQEDKSKGTKKPEWSGITTKNKESIGPHVVQQGESGWSLAKMYGFVIETIWDHGDNTRLKELRTTPDILMAGDEIVIPDVQEKEESVETGKLYTIRRNGIPRTFSVQFHLDGEPRANVAYVLDIDGVVFDGTTDGDGVVSLCIPPDAKQGKITFPDNGDEFNLDINMLDPISEISGVQERLLNLDYYSGQIDGQMSLALEQAVRAFQRANDLDATGALDDTLRAKLGEVYDN